jgi:hypothetical protein
MQLANVVRIDISGHQSKHQNASGSEAYAGPSGSQNALRAAQRAHPRTRPVLGAGHETWRVGILASNPPAVA